MGDLREDLAKYALFEIEAIFGQKLETFEQKEDFRSIIVHLVQFTFGGFLWDNMPRKAEKIFKEMINDTEKIPQDFDGSTTKYIHQKIYGKPLTFKQEIASNDNLLDHANDQLQTLEQMNAAIQNSIQCLRTVHTNLSNHFQEMKNQIKEEEVNNTDEASK